MTEDKLKATLRGNMPEPSGHFDEKISLKLAHLRADGKPRARVRAGLAVAVALVMVLGLTTALAAFSGDVNQMLYRIWPRAAMALRPVNLTSDSQGIRMNVVSASLSGPESIVMLTMQDLEGDRIDETMDLFDTANLQLPYDGSGTCVQTGYDLCGLYEIRHGRKAGWRRQGDLQREPLPDPQKKAGCGPDAAGRRKDCGSGVDAGSAHPRMGRDACGRRP